MRPCSAWCVSSFSREVVFPPCQSVCCIRVFYIFPQSCFLNCFFFSHKFRVFESFPGLLDPVSETTFFRPSSSEHPPPEREREREAAMKIHLKTLYVVLSTFSGALFSFVAFDHPLGLVFSKWISFVSSLLLIRFFQSRFPGSKTTLTRNARASLLLPRVGYKTTERRKSSTST